VSSNPAGAGIGAIVLDIEGTTTPIAFVTQVLVPYARRHLRSHLERHAATAECESLLTRLRGEHASAAHDGEAIPPWVDGPQAARVAAVATYVEWLMDRDRKSTALKELQGRIWEEGYQGGDLVGEVFPDVPRALQLWHEQQLPVAIFSSGSVLAQQLLFRHSSRGDLTGFIDRYFDTQVGTKVAPDSYRRIASAVGLPAWAVLFLSDVTRELDAAHEAGMQVRLAARPGNTPEPEKHGYEAIRSFDELVDRT
jgi:2,3-diketo-5-methylthio-1-phosphopentane phosphatase